MPLTGMSRDEIMALKSNVEKQKKDGGRSRSGKKVDTSERTFQTWFKLAHKTMDDSEDNYGEPMKCANESCQDPNPGRVSLVAEVNGKWMCRYCYLAGWLEPGYEARAGQIKLDV
jgi:hypothetical protein